MKNLINLFTLILFLFPLCIHAQCFDEVADEVGVTGYWGIPSGIPGGGGLSFVDYNQDGYDDLTFTSSRQQNISFFTNNGDGTFTLEDPPFVTNIWESKTVTWVDWDNDGDKDLYVTTRYVAGRFYENDGNMNFTDITDDIGLDEVEGTSWGANFGDYDMDGYIDLYLTRYGYSQAGGLDTNMMFRNIEGTHFEDVTFDTGTADHCSTDYGFPCTGEEGRLSFCSVFYDMDLDGDQDIYISNDHTLHANTIYENNGDGTFTDVSDVTSGNTTIYSMNAGVGDSNGDGFFDLFSTDTQQASHLIYDDSTDSYIEDADNLGTSLSSYGWGASFFDYDNDQDLDLYVCIRSDEYEDPNAFLVNDGTGSYTEPLGDSGGLGGIDHEVSHCVATGDFNLDGFLDLAVTHSGFDTDHHVWRSCETNDTTNYVKFKFFDQSSKTVNFDVLYLFCISIIC